ncbi:S-layer homology domain-containing protein [Paenibacillus alba]|uniref:S-layer homology domain-containing protein n=1 Tax=Paenibacillus alba TaxID=1197127 RepID=UPI001567C181|nr:S-layer homology domain-containing protein [Paenibacillus alba]
MLAPIQQAKADVSLPFTEGNGTAVNPYIIKTAEELNQMRNMLDKQYKLGADIDLAGFDSGDGNGWMPIGDNSNPFTGTFDGNGHVIRNLTINRSDLDFVGLFGYVFWQGTLTNIGLLYVNVTGHDYVGGLVGKTQDAINNSYVTGNVSGGTYVGGLAGESDTINYCYSTANVSGNTSAGGLAGSLTGMLISYSYATGDVSGVNFAGGLAGEHSSGVLWFNIRNAYATGKVTGQYAGGILGYQDDPINSNSVSYWNKDNVSNAIGSNRHSNLPTIKGMTAAQLKSSSTYSQWNFMNTWGIREGQSYPYLLIFSPALSVNPLPSNFYNLTPGQDRLTFTGMLQDGSIGESITLSYRIQDQNNLTVASVSDMVYATGSDQAINRSFPITGFSEGTYTLSVSAEDSHNPLVTKSITFIVDTTAPEISFSINGNDSYGSTVSTAVYATDALSGGASLQYAWTQDIAVPTSGWTSFANGETLAKTNVCGDWYLHIRAKDAAGNQADIVSNAFQRACIVNYDGNGSTGGTVPVDANAYEQNATVTVYGNTGSLVKSGYSFAGWNTRVDGSGVSYTVGSTFIMGAANMTLYAQWTRATVVPSITTQPSNQTVMAGQTATFTVAASGDTPLSYQWKKDGAALTDGGNISGSRSATLSIAGAQTGDAGSYTVLVTNTAGNVTSSAVTLTVDTAVPSTPSAPTGITAMAGDGQVTLMWTGVQGAVTYSVYQGTASGSYGLTSIATVSGATYSYTATRLTNGMTYYFAVKASNAGGNSRYSNEVSTTPKAAIPGASNNANLSSLAISGVALSPSFDPITIFYTASVVNGVTSVTVTPTVSDGNATMKVNGTVVSSGQTSGAISLNVGSNPITVAVTAQDGKTTQTYTVIVTRAKVITASSNALIQVTIEPVSIIVPSGVTNAKIVVTPVTAGSNKEATLPLVDVQAATSLGNVSVVIATGTKITAPGSWDGTIKLPQALNNNSVTDSRGNVSAIVEVGSTDVSLTFDQAVCLRFPNQGGKRVAAVRNGVFTEITSTVTADTQTAANNEIAAGGDAKITVGNDLVVWTKHFTQFVIYSPDIPASTDNDVTSDSAGGGGAATNSATIVAATGGTVTLSGATIEVPAGAMASNIQVTVDKVSDTSNLPVDSALQLVSEVYEIKKDKDGGFNKGFNKPVVIKLPFDKTKVDFSKSTAGVYWLNEQTRKWMPLDDLKVDEAGGTASGSVNFFAKFAVLASDKAKAAQPQLQTNEVNFADIKGHWSEENILELVKLGAINGYADNTFMPNANITRAEFVTVIVKAFLLGAQDGKTFADSETHWARRAIATTAAAGIVAGYSDNRFGPDDLITREQMAAIVVRAAKLSLTDKDVSFADSSDISVWARTALATATAKGLINGYADDTVLPQANATRAEAITVILRALQVKP